MHIFFTAFQELIDSIKNNDEIEKEKVKEIIDEMNSVYSGLHSCGKKIT